MVRTATLFHTCAVAVWALSLVSVADAAVTDQQASLLKSRLTPVGAERAGNADDTIPAWTGGYTAVIPGYQGGAPRPDPFADEKPLFSITARNYRDYAEKLPEGARHLFEEYPDYRMDIYPSHRSAAAPDWVYANIFRNATRAHAAPEGIAYGVEGAVGGIPFPIPQNGFEAMWNHLLAFWGPARELTISNYVVPQNGAVERASTYREIADFPYYYRDATPDSFGSYYFKTLHVAVAPPARVSESYLNWQPIDIKRNDFAAWRLLPGEHRVRKAPGISYDVPDIDAAGFMSLDEYYMFFGGLDHYDFKILGKKEMYVPYNNNRLYTRPVSEVLGAAHANPDDLRYELHRVWVIDGTLARGKHDIIAHRRLYLDEDTWLAVYSDAWDEQGRQVRFAQATMYLMPDLPAVIIGSQFNYDFELGGYAYGFAFNGEPQAYKVTSPHPVSLFSPEALSARSVR
jgi:Protein of unknown function (DUF1329)